MENQIIRKEDLPPVCINLLTYRRTDCAIQAIHGILRHLKYDGKLIWFISDNGSETTHIDRIMEPIRDYNFLGIHSKKGSIGSVWNYGIQYLGKSTPFFLRLEDDFVLHSDMDITLFVKLMVAYPDVGMVRLGQMVIDLDMYSVKFKTYTPIGYDEHIYLLVGKNKPYTYSGHPALVHGRFHQAYGMFPQNEMSAGDLELAMDNQVRNKKGPMILFPWDHGKYGPWGAWDHIGTEKA